MSKVVDERIVEMQFDNRQFEQNVSTSMSTLEKLKQSLKLDGASQGLENVKSATKGIDVGPLSNGIETVKAKFSALEVIGVTALANIANSAVNTGKKLVAAFTIDPIKTGFQEYETQINAVQTILANTASKGTNLKQVNEALDELNLYADKTIYNFTEMTRNIGTFTAAGIDLDTSVNAIQGIANLAAVSGSTSQQASTAMYQLSQALSSGTVRLMDWNSVVNAGMGGQVFQDALKKTSKELGTGAEAAIKANGSFRESLKTGWLTSEVLTETLKKFTTSGANEYVAEYCGVSADAVQSALDAAKAQYGEADAIDKAAEALAKKTGKNKDEIKQALEFAKTAEDAATKVKTFTQLMDTLKEAAQSGWTQTWEILVGDFEEAKALFTEISDTLGGIIGKSADARNKVLQEWKDLGGRTAILDSIKNIFESLVSIITPIKEAFREIFPPVTAQQLLKISECIRDLTAKFILSEKQSEKLKSTFKGLFAIIDIVVTVIKKLVGGLFELIGHFTGVTGGILDVTGSIGNMLTKFRDGVKSVGLFGKTIDVIVYVLGKAIDKIKEFGSFVGNKILSPGLDGILNVLKSIWNFMQKIGSKISNFGSNLGKGITNAFANGDIKNVIGALNGGIFAGILLGLKKFVDSFGDAETLISSIFKGIGNKVQVFKDIFDSVGDSLKAWQQNLKAGTLMKLAGAIGILAASILILSSIDPKKLASSLGAITTLFADLLTAMTVLDKLSLSFTGVGKTATIMIGMSISILILASALKKIADLDIGQLTKGVIGILALTSILVAASKVMASDGKTIIKGAGQMILMAAALKILASVCKDLGSLSWNELAKGGVGILALVSILVGAAKIMNQEEVALIKFAGQMILLSIAVSILGKVAVMLSALSWNEIAKSGVGILALVSILVGAAKIMNQEEVAIAKFAGQMIMISVAISIVAKMAEMLSSLSWNELAKGGVGILGIVTMLVAAAKIMSTDGTSMVQGAGQMLVMAAAIGILAISLKAIGNMSWESIAKGLVTLGVSLTILIVALNAMEGTIAGSAALLIASIAIGALVPSLKALGSMSLGSIIKSLLALAGAFIVIGVGAVILSTVAGPLVIAAGALLLFGVAVAAFGAGVFALAAGLSMLAVSGVAGITAFVASLEILIDGILGLIPKITKAIVAIVKALVEAFVECIPTVVEGLFKFIVKVLDALVEYGPQIIDKLLTFFIGILDSVTERMPELVSAFMNFLAALIQGIADNIQKLIQPGVDLVVAIFQGIADAVGPLIEGILVPILEVLKDLIVGIIDVIANAIAPYIPTICDCFTTMTQIISDAIVKIVEVIAPFAPEFQKMVEAITRGVEAICNVFTTLLQQVAPIINSIVDLVRQLGDSISQIFYSLAAVIKTCGDAISEILTSVGDVISSVFNGIADVICSVGESIKSVLDGIADIIKAIGESALNAGKGFKYLADGVKKITDLNLADMALSLGAVATGIKEIAKHSEGLAEVGTGMQQIATNVSMSSAAFNLMSYGIGTVKTALSSLGPTASSSMSVLVSSVNASSNCFSVMSSAANLSANSVKMAFSSIVVTVTSSSSRISSAMISTLSKSISMINGRIGAFVSAGKRLMQGFQNGVKSGSVSLSPYMVSLISKLYSAVSSKIGMFIKVGMTLMRGLSSGLKSGGTGTISSIMSALTRCILAINGYYGLFQSAGMYAASGFAAGIRSGSFTAEIAARAMAQAAVKAAKDALKINSPSKVFRSIGSGVPEGFAQGIGKCGDIIKKQTLGMTNVALNSAKDAVSKIGKIATGDLDIKPTISPVVNSSNIKANNIQLGANIDATMSKPIGSLSQIMANAQNKINASNEEVIASIKGLREDLSTLYTSDDKEVAFYVDSKKMASTMVNPINQKLCVIAKRTGGL